jgi:uncharacterized short protein YbdD (DUF466 family)
MGWLGEVAQSLRLMVGVPSHDVYMAHMRKTHPRAPAMSYGAFFIERQQAPYWGGGGAAADSGQGFVDAAALSRRGVAAA